MAIYLHRVVFRNCFLELLYHSYFKKILSHNITCLSIDRNKSNIFQILNCLNSGKRSWLLGSLTPDKVYAHFSLQTLIDHKKPHEFEFEKTKTLRNFKPFLSGI